MAHNAFRYIKWFDSCAVGDKLAKIGIWITVSKYKQPTVWPGTYIRPWCDTAICTVFCVCIFKSYKNPFPEFCKNARFATLNFSCRTPLNFPILLIIWFLFTNVDELFNVYSYCESCWFFIQLQACSVYLHVHTCNI